MSEKRKEYVEVVMCESCYATNQIADRVCRNCGRPLRDRNEEGFIDGDAVGGRRSP